jgi:hypothetical protein
MDKLPVEAVKAMKELDRLARKDTWTDGDATCAVGYQARMFGAVVMRALQAYAPDVFAAVVAVAVR